ncbi:hypothetical protein [Nocardia thraciensis]
MAEADPEPRTAVVRAGAEPILAQGDPGEGGSVRSLVHGRRDLRALEFTGGTARGEREFAHDNDELIYVVRHPPHRPR